LRRTGDVPVFLTDLVLFSYLFGSVLMVWA
jgi:hypothetical protein